MKASMLVMTLMTAADPTGPMWKIRLPIACSAGLCRSNVAASPPISTVISPRAARCTPPVTGDSSMPMPASAASAARRWISVRPSVDISIQSAPAFIAGRIWRSTASLTAGEGRQVMTASAPATASAALSAHVTPSASNRALWLVSRSCTVSANPARASDAARWPPRFPSPI